MGTMDVTINLGTLLTVLVSMLAAAAGWYFGSSGSRKLAARVGHFFDDWNGAPARDGVPARPGVMLRLEQHDKLLAQINEQQHSNGGSTLRDEVRVTRDEVRVISTQVGTLAALATTNMLQSTPAGPGDNGEAT